MDRKPSLPSMSSRSSSASSLNRNHEPLLPYAWSPEKPAFRLRSLLGHCLYRRVLVWSVISLVIVALTLFHTREESVYDLAGRPFSDPKPSVLPGGETSKAPSDSDDEDPGFEVVVVLGDEVEKSKPKPSPQPIENLYEFVYEDDEDEEDDKEDNTPPPPPAEDSEEGARWLKFKHLDAYFHGLKTLVTNMEDHEAEYPNTTRPAPFPEPPINEEPVPKPRPYNPYRAQDDVKTCYLDEDNTIPAPDIYAYDGVTRYAPDPAIGSYDVLGLNGNVCFDRFGRYGPYGLGYSKVDGGTGTGMDTESSNSGEVWAQSGRINYVGMDWGSAQERCYEANKHRFRGDDEEPRQELRARSRASAVAEKNGRIAIVIRLYTGFKWTEHVLLNFRALINEVSLRSGGEYVVHFLMHVRDTDAPIWADDVTVKTILDANVPPEFHNIVTLWSEPQMHLMYPGAWQEPAENPSLADIHGVYRSAHFPLQVFAMEHPEYDHVWNWEMDMRYLGNYYELFDRIGIWAAKQPRPLAWERAERYYIPSYHGSWKNFTKTVKKNVRHSGRDPIFGPLDFEGMKPLRHEQKGDSVMPEGCEDENNARCGVGEDADFISLNPIFDAENSGWVFAQDATGWNRQAPPRRCAIITASRLSRRLLLAMHEEVWRHHHSMFSEMFPPSVALHHGFKAVYAPHPVFLDRAWNPPAAINAAFNGGRDQSTSGHGSPYDLQNEHNHAGASWYYNSEFSGLLWRRWLGYPQMDGRGDGGGRSGEGALRGGLEEESREDGTGRMCMRSVLLHPIKREHPTES